MHEFVARPSGLVISVRSIREREEFARPDVPDFLLQVTALRTVRRGWRSWSAISTLQM